jgi:hypothetical protein
VKNEGHSKVSGGEMVHSRANEGKDAELLGRCAILRQLVKYGLWNVDEGQVPQAMGASPKSVENLKRGMVWGESR